MVKYRLLSPMILGDSLPKNEPKPCHRELIDDVVRELEPDPKIVMMGGTSVDDEQDIPWLTIAWDKHRYVNKPSSQDLVTTFPVSEDAFEPMIISPRFDIRNTMHRDVIHHKPQLAIIGANDRHESIIRQLIEPDFEVLNRLPFVNREVLERIDSKMLRPDFEPFIIHDSFDQLSELHPATRRGYTDMRMKDYGDAPAADSYFDDHKNILQDPTTNSLRKMRTDITKVIAKARKKNKAAKKSRRQNRN